MALTWSIIGADETVRSIRCCAAFVVRVDLDEAGVLQHLDELRHLGVGRATAGVIEAA